MNLFSLAKSFPSEEHALTFWIKERWPDGVRCIACDCDKVYLIETKGKTGKPYRKFQCSDCGLHFSPTAGTLFHDSHLPLQKWFMAIALMTEAKKGISAKQVQRHIGVAYKTAWYVCHRIRHAMQEDPSFKVGGPDKTVEMDEMYVGGRYKLQGVKNPSKKKQVVVGLAERGGRLHMQVVRTNDRKNLTQVYKDHIEAETPKVVTDGNQTYLGIIPRVQHEAGNHGEEMWTKGRITSTYTIEGAFSLFKRGIIGNYHRLSEEHLDRYLGEFCWRFNRRRMQPWMFSMVLQNMAKAKPLSYANLTDDGFYREIQATEDQWTEIPF